jgi:hypothetical protein
VVARRDEWERVSTSITIGESKSGDEQRDSAPGAALMPSERARLNLALLYGGARRTPQPSALLGPIIRPRGCSGC